MSKKHTNIIIAKDEMRDFVFENIGLFVLPENIPLDDTPDFIENNIMPKIENINDNTLLSLINEIVLLEYSQISYNTCQEKIAHYMEEHPFNSLSKILADIQNILNAKDKISYTTPEFEKLDLYLKNFFVNIMPKIVQKNKKEISKIFLNTNVKKNTIKPKKSLGL